MATKSEHDGYTSFQRIVIGQCPVSVVDAGTTHTYTSRYSTGGNGRGVGAIPQVNAYNATFRSQESSSVAVSLQRRSYDFPCGTDSFKRYTCTKEFSLAAPVPVAPGPPFSKGELTTRLRSKAFDKLHTFQGGVALAEFAKTARMVISPFRYALKHTNRVLDEYVSNLHAINGPGRPRRSKMSKRQIAASAKAARDAYLTWQLGIMPLMSDIQSGTKAFYQNITNNQPSVRVTKIVTKSISADGTTSHGQVPSGFENMAYVTETTTASSSSQQSYAYLQHFVSLTGAGQSRRNLGFDFESFVPTIWEAIPFSFVADYVTNIGEIIQGQSVDARQIYGGAFTIKSEANTTALVKALSFDAPDTGNISSTGPFAVSVSSVSTRSTEKYFARSPISRDEMISPPVFRFENPSIRQLVNVGALLSSFSHPTLGVSERDRAAVRRFFKT